MKAKHVNISEDRAGKSVGEDRSDGIYEYSDAQIGALIIGGGAVLALLLCLGLCGFLHR